MKKILLSLCLLLINTSAHALTSSGKEANIFALSTSAGIVAPSESTSVFQNPAAISHIPKLNINATAGTSRSFGSPTLGGGIMYGGGNYGIVGGVRATPSNATSNAYFGLGAEITSIKTSIGIAGTYGLSPSGGTTINAGLLFMPMEKVRLGFNAVGLASSIAEWGGGIALELNPAASFVFDMTADPTFTLFNFEPGFLIVDQNLGATVSYGFGNGAFNQVISGFTFGAFASLAQTVKLEIYFSENQVFFGSLTVHLL